MKVISKTEMDECGGGIVTISVDGEERFQVLADPECPEDFTFYRNLNPCLHIHKLMRLAYEAGKRDEPFEVEEVEE